MAEFTLGQLLTMTRQHSGDTNTTNPGIDSVTIRSFIMEWCQFFQAGFGLDVTPGAAITLAVNDKVNGANITTASGPLQVYRAISDKVDGEMEIKSVAEILALQRSAPATGVVKKVAIEILGGTVRFFTVYPHPIPSTSTVITLSFQAALVELATDGSADASLILLTLLGARAAMRYAAADVARLCGRDQTYIENILAPLPNYIKILGNLRDTRLRPRAEPEKVGS